MSTRSRDRSAERDDRRPTTRRVLDEISEFIRSSGLESGDRLPSETELAARFGVARGSVREALKLLEQDGLIDVRHGRGRFVSGLSRFSVSSPVTSFESVTEMVAGRGLALETRVLSVGARPGERRRGDRPRTRAGRRGGASTPAASRRRRAGALLVERLRGIAARRTGARRPSTSPDRSSSGSRARDGGRCRRRPTSAPRSSLTTSRAARRRRPGVRGCSSPRSASIERARRCCNRSTTTAATSSASRCSAGGYNTTT